ncbi:DUF262 domain-containing protein [Xanthomonas campestris]|uniref:DUF262 domain-containing protein n=1 Tax=Xanthomonas campestris TaxID=339 RepID=UPI001E477995|nr:DUF262 domain-containing protein [Xanthomonas campestris]MCC5049577.1 DUF262 domain-containing protein [Xanthomonas campestris]MCC5057890.1 DUF262 domain-containing protein [Xanthomonas campestris]MCC5062014.1 DUF262 domain-containing protein [Xanthomonas campestris]MCF8795249.1 DUF262 domain-containing protein [Xanthomonas campestris pv. campestris]MCF8812592.1 DUF262 domain-containing protein [Xanthomonas campestris pv. campestris]
MAKPKPPGEFTDQQREEAENQIRLHQREVDYQTKEYIVEILVKKYRDGLEDDENEIFIPNYQRKFVWSVERQSKFIESVMLGLPVPYIFIASLPRGVEDDEGRAEVVDGSQRIRTLSAFTANELTLTGLEKCEKLNGSRFADLELSRQRKFNRQSVRVIELSDKADENIRRDVFERINTGSDELRDMEKRRGIYSGPFYEFIKDRAKDDLFRTLCPISYAKERREEAEELVLRYFAYCDKYLDFKHDVGKFLSQYLKEQQANFDGTSKRAQFELMLNFAKGALPYGFKKGQNANTTPRVRFEALSCGITLALREEPNLIGDPKQVTTWLESEKFRDLTASDASNSLPRLKGRIEFVRDHLLAGG